MEMAMRNILTIVLIIVGVGFLAVLKDHTAGGQPVAKCPVNWNFRKPVPCICVLHPENELCRP